MDAFAAREFYAVVVGGSALAGVAGYVNAVTLLGKTPVPASHVTGHTSKLALALSETIGRADLVATPGYDSKASGCVIPCFLFGAIVSGALLDSSRFALSNRYAYVMLIEAGALFVACVAEQQGKILGLALCAFACGLQNAMVSSYSGAVLRTTHMTGVITDIGVVLGSIARHLFFRIKAKLFRTELREVPRLETWRIKVLVPLWLAFLFGGTLGYEGRKSFRESALLVPAFVLFGLAIAYLLWRPTLDARTELALRMKRLQNEFVQIIPPHMRDLHPFHQPSRGFTQKTNATIQPPQEVERTAVLGGGPATSPEAVAGVMRSLAHAITVLEPEPVVVSPNMAFARDIHQSSPSDLGSPVPIELLPVTSRPNVILDNLEVDDAVASHPVFPQPRDTL